MRIELNSGGLGGSAVISGFQTDFSSLISKSRRVVSSFQVVKTFSNHMNGGIGSLQNAVDQIDSRMQQEEAKADALKTAQKQSEDFLELVHTIDEKVSILVNRNKHDFYDKNPWAKPPQPDKAKSYYDKAKDYVCKKVQQVKDGIKNIAKAVIKLNKDVIDGISKLWNSAVEFYQANKEKIHEFLSSVGKIVLAVVIIGALVGLTILTCGMNLTICATILGMGAIGATAGGIYGVAKGIHEYNSNGKKVSLLTSISNNMLSGTIEGGASGIADGIGLVVPGGPIVGVIARGISGEFLQVGAKGICNQFVYGQSADEAWDGAWADGTADNFVDTIAFGIIPHEKLLFPKNQIILKGESSIKYFIKNTVKPEFEFTIPKILLSMFTGCDSAKDIIRSIFTPTPVY